MAMILKRRTVLASAFSMLTVPADASALDHVRRQLSNKLLPIHRRHGFNI
jgi:hypothetical protein